MKKLAILTLFLAGVASAPAATISLTGTFAADDDVALFSFSVSSPSNVTLRTLSYAGGTNGAGASIAPGGFDPIVSLFDAAGTFLDLVDDSFSAPVDPVTGLAADAELMIFLAPGMYQVALTQFDNVPVGDLVDGFLLTGDPTLTAIFGCSNGQFCDQTGANRTNFYALDLINVDDQAQIPEPGTMVLLGSAVAAMAWRRRR